MQATRACQLPGRRSNATAVPQCRCPLGGDARCITPQAQLDGSGQSDTYTPKFELEEAADDQLISSPRHRVKLRAFDGAAALKNW